MLQKFARPPEEAADRGAVGDLRAGRECGDHRHRRRRRGDLQDGEPQPPVLHRALSGRGDGGRRDPARRVHDGRAADRQPQRAALRPARPSQDAAPGRRRGRGDRRLRQLRRRPHGRRRGQFRRGLRRQHPGQCDDRRRREDRQDFLFGRDRHRQSDRLCRLQDRPRRDPRRDHGAAPTSPRTARRSARRCRSATRSPRNC